MPDTYSQDEELKMLNAIKRAASQVADDEDPNAALTKVAREQQFTPGAIRILCASFNTGRQTAQFKGQESILDKLASFPLADADVVINGVYGKQEKKADISDEYNHGPTWLEVSEPVTEKVASAPEVRTPGSEYLLTQMMGKIAKVEREAQDFNLAAITANTQLVSKIASLVDYFKQPEYARLPFAAVEKSAEQHLGADAVTLLGIVHKQAYSRDKRASDRHNPILTRPVPQNSGPIALLRESLKLANDYHDFKQKSEACHVKAAALKEEMYRPVRPPVPTKTATGDDDNLLFGKSAAPAPYMPALAVMMNKFVGTQPSKDSLVSDAWLKLDDPAHQNEIRKIRSQAMLNGMMTDKDDPISGYDPDRVLNAYNEIAQMAPRLSEQPAAMRPLMRRRLAGNIEPFETKELADVEKTLMQTKAPTKLS